MTADDLHGFVEDLAAETKTYVETYVTHAAEGLRDAFAPRVTRLEADVVALKGIVPQPGRDGIDGKDADLAAVKTFTEAMLTAALAGLPALVGAEVAKAIAALPVPKDGKDGAPGRDGVEGIHGKDGRDGIDGKDGAVGLSGKDGRDGVGLTGALVTRQGTLTVTLSDGQTKDVGPVVPDGETITRLVGDQVKTFPVPKDGAPGPPGRDGTLEQLQVVYDGKRTVTLCRKDAGPIDGGVLVLPIVIDEGVWKPGVTYTKGDGTTWGGSFWIAQETTTAKPGEAGTASRAWRLAVKRGTDGKDGRDGKDAE